MGKRVLMVAYHYPPVGVSSGLHRTLNFSRYLADYGWQSAVLTIHPRAYARRDGGSHDSVPPGVVVRRPWALDTTRDLALRGIYPGWLALPDPWVSWWFTGVAEGLRLVRAFRPSVIWSTYPIATAHLIARTLHALTNLPWVADFRDPMVMAHYPPPSLKRRIHGRIERMTVASCSRAVFVTPGALREHRERYPEVPVARWELIPNGFDEEVFRTAERAASPARPNKARLTLLHSGLLELEDRDPRPFLDALRRLRESDAPVLSGTRFVLRATGNDEFYRREVEMRCLETFVSVAPAVPYPVALKEMIEADGLLLLQGPTCNSQIPAKLYEYLRAGRPILALTDPSGDTASVLKEAGVSSVARIDSDVEIANTIKEFLDQVRKGTTTIPGSSFVSRYSRRSLTGQLASVLESVSGVE